MAKLMLSVLATDRPGVVSDLAAMVADAGGSWLDSQLGSIGGKFGGVVLIEADHHALFEVMKTQDRPGDQAIDIMVTEVDDTASAEPAVDGETFNLSVVGTDRPGIVRLFSQALAEAGASIVTLATESREGPWGAGMLFQADAVVRLAEGTELQTVRETLEDIADDLVVDIEADAEPEA